MAVGAEPGWLTLAEAARSLGLSNDAVRRRLKRGELAGRRVTTRYGLGWLVNLDIAPTPAPTVADAGTLAPTVAPASERPAEVLELVRLIERQQTTIMELAGRVGFYQAELEQARDTIRALQAPATPGPTSEAPATATSPSDSRLRAPWWRSWLAAVAP